MEILNKILYKLHIKKPPRSHKGERELLPPPVKDILEKENLDTSSVIFSVKTDMCGAEEYGDVYIFFDEKGIYTAEIEEPINPKKNKKKVDFKPKLLKLTSILLQELLLLMHLLFDLIRIYKIFY